MKKPWFKSRRVHVLEADVEGLEFRVDDLVDRIEDLEKAFRGLCNDIRELKHANRNKS